LKVLECAGPLADLADEGGALGEKEFRIVDHHERSVSTEHDHNVLQT
jgi:hypothetical protein